jgi:hypothetical protein
LICELGGALTLWAVRGEVQFTGCDSFEAWFDTIGTYDWPFDITPFVDPFDFDFIPPGSDPLPAWYSRMPAP